MIENLQIDGFRGLDDLDVGALGRVNLIVGPGGSGKTNLLEAVFLFCETGNAAGLNTILAQRGMSVDNRTPAEAADILSWFASTGRELRACKINGQWGGLQRSVTIQRTTPTIFAQQVQIVSPGAVTQDITSLIAQSVAVFKMETQHAASTWVGSLYATPQGLVNSPASGAPHFPSRFHGVMAHRGASQGLAPLWTQVEDRGESTQVEELLRLLDPDVDSVRVAAGQSSPAYVRVHHRRLGHVPLEFLGDGFSKALSLACNLVAAAGGVLLVDEVEVSLYVGALSTIVSFAIEAAKRLDVQLFLSTHDLDVVDAFIDRAGTEDTLHILRLARPGAKTRFHNIDHARARTLRDDIGIDLRRAG
jgi:hypothetical protein